MLYFQNPECKYSDMGAGYVGEGQNRVLRLLKEYNMELFQTPIEGNEIYYRNLSIF